MMTQQLNEDYDFAGPAMREQGVLLGDNGPLPCRRLPLFQDPRTEYLLDLVIPIQFSESPNTLVTMTANGTVHASGSFTETFVPEPCTLTMLLGLAASLAGYSCWKRRMSR